MGSIDYTAVRLQSPAACFGGGPLQVERLADMATDPVENIFLEERETPFSVDLRRHVRELAYLEPNSKSPYISAYIDWRPEGESPGFRPGTRLFENEAASRLRELRSAGVDPGQVEAGFDRIREVLRDSIDPAVHGIFILSNEAAGVFEMVQVAMPLETRVKVGSTPALRGLANIAEDYPPFIVLHADQYDAQIYVVSRASLRSEVVIEADREPVTERQGAWAYRRYRNRLDERMQHFARAIAEEVRRRMVEEKIEMLVLSTSEVFGPVLQGELHHSVAEKVVGRLHMASNAPEHQIVNAGQDLARDAERKREDRDLERLNDALGTGRGGASGPSEVVRALTSGQVSVLLMARNFREEGWADYTLPAYGTGAVPAKHPVDGESSNLVKTDLGEEMVRLALSTGAEVEILPAARAALLEQHGGVAALLRY